MKPIHTRENKTEKPPQYQTLIHSSRRNKKPPKHPYIFAHKTPQSLHNMKPNPYIHPSKRSKKPSLYHKTHSILNQRKAHAWIVWALTWFGWVFPKLGHQIRRFKNVLVNISQSNERKQCGSANQTKKHFTTFWDKSDHVTALNLEHCRTSDEQEQASAAIRNQARNTHT